MLRDNIVFLKEFIDEFEQVGSFCPTSEKAATALTHPLRHPRAPKRILEVGAGTGTVTSKILPDLGPNDEFIICEINPRLMQILRKNVLKHPSYAKNRDRITFFEGPVQAMPEGKKFDVIVCALPFLNFEIALVRDIFRKLERMSAVDAVMTYYEYIGLRTIGKQFSPAKRRDRLTKLDQFWEDVSKEKLIERRRIWWNLLPINVYTVELAA